MNEQEIRDGIAFVSAVLRYCDDLATAENRNLTDDEQTHWNAGMAYIADAQRKLDRIVELRGLAATPGSTETTDAPEIMTRVQPFNGEDALRMNRSEVRDRALKVLEDREAAGHLEDRQMAHIERVLRARSGNIDGSAIARRLLVTENPHYRSAFMKLTCNPHPVLTSEEGQAVQAYEELRAMSIGSDTAGGFGVPVLIDPTIVLTAQGSPNDILAASRVEVITNDEWKGVSSAGVTWGFDAEATEVGDDSPVLAQPVVPVHKAQGFIPYSIEVGQDYPGFASEMARLLSEGYSELVAEAFTTGSGSNQPTGIVTALDANTNVEVTPTTDGAFGAVDVYKLWDALPIRYRARATWISSTDVQNEVRQFGTDQAHQFTVNLTQDAIARLFGRPYPVNDFMADFTGTTGAANLLIVGDFSNFLIAQRAGMTVELVPHLFATGNNRPSGQRGWYAHARVGSDSVNDLGFRVLQNQ